LLFSGVVMFFKFMFWCAFVFGKLLHCVLWAEGLVRRLLPESGHGNFCFVFCRVDFFFCFGLSQFL